MTVHYVYRVYDRAENLIYIGCTLDLFRRIEQHHLNSWWSYQISRVQGWVFPTKEAGRAAEAAAILTEQPRWNRFGLRPWTEQTRLEFHDRVVSGATQWRVWREQPRYWVTEQEHYLTRFGEHLPLTELLLEAARNAELAAEHHDMCSKLRMQLRAAA